MNMHYTKPSWDSAQERHRQKNPGALLINKAKLSIHLGKSNNAQLDTPDKHMKRKMALKLLLIEASTAREENFAIHFFFFNFLKYTLGSPLKKRHELIIFCCITALNLYENINAIQLFLPAPLQLIWKQFPAKGAPYKWDFSREWIRRYTPAAVLFGQSMAHSFSEVTI